MTLSNANNPSPALPLVLVTETLDPVPAQWLQNRVRMVWCKTDQPEFPSLLAQAQGLVIRTYTIITESFLQQAPNLRVIGRAGVGLDNVDLHACREKNIEVVYTPDANTQAVVEYVWALLLDVLRPRPRMQPAMTEEAFHHQRKVAVGTQLDQLKLGILGMGRIGKRLGKSARAMGIRVLGNDLLPEKQIRDTVDYDFDFVDKSTLYSQSDILTIHVDGRKENRHLINKQVLSQLKPHCLLINAARGFLIDNHALAQWAKDHPQARVILDVHDPEPPPADYPLYGLANVELLPHLASRTTTATENMSWVVRDVAAVLAGEKPQFSALSPLS